MRKHTNDRLQGTLDLLVLKTLDGRGSMHGYGITLHIETLHGSNNHHIAESAFKGLARALHRPGIPFFPRIARHPSGPHPRAPSAGELPPDSIRERNALSGRRMNGPPRSLCQALFPRNETADLTATHLTTSI